MYLGHTLLHFGELVAARTHLEHGIILCDSSYPAIRLLTGGLEPKNSCLSWMPRALWLLGYRDQPLRPPGHGRALPRTAPAGRSWGASAGLALGYFGGCTPGRVVAK